jgi:Zn-finger nucleic acid-binding protein
MTVRCPRDQSELTVRDTEGHVGFRCPVCQGAWLPARYIQSIQYTHVFSYAAFARSLAEQPAIPTSLMCPAGCGTLTATSAFDVPFSRCRSCEGVWFEPGTIRSLLARMPRPDSDLASGQVIAGQIGAEIAVWTILLGLLS